MGAIVGGWSSLEVEGVQSIRGHEERRRCSRPEDETQHGLCGQLPGIKTGMLSEIGELSLCVIVDVIVLYSFHRKRIHRETGRKHLLNPALLSSNVFGDLLMLQCTRKRVLCCTGDACSWASMLVAGCITVPVAWERVSP